MNIYLPIEVKIRELEGKTLLALIAAERGHTVVLGEKKDTINLARDGIFPPGIVHDKSLTPGDYKIENFTGLKENGHMITAQDEESGLLDDSFDVFAKRRFSEKTVSLVDKIFAWGRHDCQSLKKIYPRFADKIVSTGSPRVDFWRNELDGYYQWSSTSSPQKPLILFASNFGFPIDENPFWNRITRLRKSGYFERDPGMEHYMYENTAYQYRLLYSFIEMIRKLSVSFPDVQIMVRPHPVESVGAWKKLLGEFPNVIIKREGTISGWIRSASVLLHNGCSSALEAAVSGLPRIAYRPIPHELEREIPNKTSLHAFSMEELENMVSDILEKGNTRGFVEAERLAGEIIGQRFSSIEGRLAAEKIVDEWEEIGTSIHSKQISADELLQKKPKKGAPFHRRVKKQLVKIRNRVIPPPDLLQSNEPLLKSEHKFPDFKDEEMQQMHQHLQAVLNRFHQVEFKRFGKKSFVLYRK